MTDQPAFKAYTDMTTEERATEIETVAAMFVGLPGVVGAPLILGPGYWSEIARHLVECGVRVVAGSIKHYEPGDSPDVDKAAGKWVYDTDEPEESFEDMIARKVVEEREDYLAKVERLRADGVLAPANASPSERARFRQERAARAEAAGFKREQAARRREGTLDGSPLDGVKRPKRKGR